MEERAEKKEVKNCGICDQVHWCVPFDKFANEEKPEFGACQECIEITKDVKNPCDECKGRGFRYQLSRCEIFKCVMMSMVGCKACNETGEKQTDEV